MKRMIGGRSRVCSNMGITKWIWLFWKLKRSVVGTRGARESRRTSGRGNNYCLSMSWTHQTPLIQLTLFADRSHQTHMHCQASLRDSYFSLKLRQPLLPHQTSFLLSPRSTFSKGNSPIPLFLQETTCRSFLFHSLSPWFCNKLLLIFYFFFNFSAFLKWNHSCFFPFLTKAPVIPCSRYTPSVCN